ncbi:hypothetical protein OAM69_00385 [bacterium]|nr:hypothetical protein [bacterium]
MHVFRTLTLLGTIVLVSACATSGSTPDSEAVPVEEQAEPALIEALPETVDSFDYTGYKYFEDGSGGYSVRYSNTRKRRIADLYVYPVAEENADLEHNQLVMGSTRATLTAISEATRQGHYANFNVINAATRAQGLRTTARVQATYLRENLASYTLVYQTEYEGTLLKIRLSMPDNEFNRSSREWDSFADTMFKKAIESVDLAKSSDAGESSDKLIVPTKTEDKTKAPKSI